jgi:hypothetical protein
MTYVLWIVQAVLALVFIFAGSVKLIMPLDLLVAQTSLPGLFVRFIGIAEVLGGLGLILPGLLRIRPGLTPLAAFELANVTVGAAVITFATTSDPLLSLMPLAVAGLCGFVAYGRGRLVPHRQRPTRRKSPTALQPTIS